MLFGQVKGVRAGSVAATDAATIPPAHATAANTGGEGKAAARESGRLALAGGRQRAQTTKVITALPLPKSRT
ncbi:hypothetical protein GCM10019016_079070 [Streptomyces prasinosporus]|uniref:Uncharacterized protein n=1 Tax=Streptomyces prasinosporus TaxID=68256 RepID=A0ABP6TZM2_9ACTN|nr:hypothetical protein GCM10010332_49290 [Streptomyces albogriseolus]